MISITCKGSRWTTYLFGYNNIVNQKFRLRIETESVRKYKTDPSSVKILWIGRSEFYLLPSSRWIRHWPQDIYERPLKPPDGYLVLLNGMYFSSEKLL